MVLFDNISAVVALKKAFKSISACAVIESMRNKREQGARQLALLILLLGFGNPHAQARK
jgi:hypothetical protein